MENDYKVQVEKLQGQINELRKEAENLKKSNPEHAVINARKACEAICTFICIEKELVKDSRSANKMSLDRMINLIQQNGSTPRHIIDDIKSIQRKGNTVAHCIEKINPEDAEPVLYALSNLVNWYFSGTTAIKDRIVEPEGPLNIPKDKNSDGFIEAAKGALKIPWVKTAAASVMAATATALAAKGLNKLDKKDKE